MVVELLELHLHPLRSLIPSLVLASCVVDISLCAFRHRKIVAKVPDRKRYSRELCEDALRWKAAYTYDSFFAKAGICCFNGMFVLQSWFLAVRLSSETSSLWFISIEIHSIYLSIMTVAVWMLFVMIPKV